MNTPEQNVEKTAEHEGFIKTPKQLITIIILAFVVPIVVISLLIRLVIASTPLGVGSDAQSQEAVAKRIQPVAGFALVTAEASSEERTGEQVYAATCSACHTAGVAGAPKLGDAAAWGPLIEKGFDTLLTNAINGINAMPPRGGNPNLSDLEVARAVAHLANGSGADFPEPEAAEGGEGAAASGDEQATSEETAAQEAAVADAAAASAEGQAASEAAPGQEGQAAADAAQQAADAAEQSAAADPGAENAQQGEAAAEQSDAGNVDLAAGEKLYKTSCFACHDAGVAGAPKFGDKAVWAPLIAEGMDKMVKIAIEGKGVMPPRGGTTASDEELSAAVHYMVNAAQ